MQISTQSTVLPLDCDGSNPPWPSKPTSVSKTADSSFRDMGSNPSWGNVAFHSTLKSLTANEKWPVSYFIVIGIYSRTFQFPTLLFVVKMAGGDFPKKY